MNQNSDGFGTKAGGRGPAESVKPGIVTPFRAVVAFLLLLSIPVGCIFYLTSTNSGSVLVLSLIAENLQKNSGIGISFGEISGDLFGGVSIASLTGRIPSGPLGITVFGLKSDVSLLPFLLGKPVMVKLECESVFLKGSIALDWLASVPDIPVFACFAGSGPSVDFSSITIRKLVWSSSNSGPVQAEVSDFKLFAPDEAGIQKLEFNLLGSFRDRELVSGGFVGERESGRLRASGNLSLRVLGHNSLSQMVVSQEKSGLKVSGNLEEFRIQLASISNWLIPMWQDDVPIGFDGVLSAGGTWAVDPEVGFCANFRGSLLSVRAVLIGFFLPLIQANLNWSLVNENLAITDTGSRLFTAPATFSGGVRNLFSGYPLWDMGFSSPLICIKTVISSLPWALKYSLGLNEIDGEASLSVRLGGSRPTVLGIFSSKRLEVKEKYGSSTLEVRCQFRLDNIGSPTWQFDVEHTSESHVPEVLLKLDRNSFTQSQAQPPVRFRATAIGTSPGELSMRAGLTASGTSRELLADWVGPWWDEFTVLSVDHPEHFSLNPEQTPFSIWQLFLFQGS